MKDIKRSVRFFFQRLFRGWDDSETWNLDCRLAEHILPRLKRFKEVNIGRPPTLSWEQWQQHLDEMIYAFEWHASDCVERDDSAEIYARVQKGVELFAQFYGHLWW